MKLYYVYRITNRLLGKHYYGCRSIPSNVLPVNDLGVKYFSSSRDREFIKDQKQNREAYKYIILYVTYDKRKALNLEVRLHKRFNVGSNPLFYNNAMQTSTGFSCNLTHNRNKGNRLMLNVSTMKPEIVKQDQPIDGYIGITKGKFKVFDSKTGLVIQTSIMDFDSSYMIPCNTDKVVALDVNTGKKLLVDSSEFANNPNLIGHSKGYVTVFDVDGNKQRIKTTEYDPNKFKHHNQGVKHSIETKQKLSKIRQKMMTVRNVDNHICRMSVLDDRFVSGEYAPLTSNRYIAYNNADNSQSTIISIGKFLSKLGADDNTIKRLLRYPKDKIQYNEYTFIKQKW